MNEPPRQLQAAMGYLQLGMAQDANDELEELSPELRTLDEVLALRIEICQRLAKWESARGLAESLAKRSPENPDWWLVWSYSLRRDRSVEDARVVLRKASEIHPDVPLIAYNLACYSCVLGDLAEARTLLKIAFDIDPGLRMTALDDPDLDPIFGHDSAPANPPSAPPPLPDIRFTMIRNPSSSMEHPEDPTLQHFWERLYAEWLPTYCTDPKRQYPTEGFTKGNADLDALDARDFMRAIDHRLVDCDAGGRFTMPRSNAAEVIFWEHERSTVPRKITLWLEPVITIAAVARLHLDYGWPLECLGMQSKDYAFDLTAFLPGESEHEYIAGEVKPTSSQISSLIRNLNHCCSSGAHDECLKSSARKNAHRKWLGLARSKAPLFWAIGPGGDSRVFEVGYEGGCAVSLNPTDSDRLKFR